MRQGVKVLPLHDMLDEALQRGRFEPCRGRRVSSYLFAKTQAKGLLRLLHLPLEAVDRADVEVVFILRLAGRISGSRRLHAAVALARHAAAGAGATSADVHAGRVLVEDLKLIDQPPRQQLVAEVLEADLLRCRDYDSSGGKQPAFPALDS